MNFKKIFQKQKDENEDVVILTEKQAKNLVDSENYYNIHYEIGDSDGIVELENNKPQRFIVSDELATEWAKKYSLEVYGAYEIVENAYNAWNPYFNDGVVFYDFEEDSIVPIALMKNESISDDWNATPIYKIGSNDLQYIAIEENLFSDLDYDFFKEYSEKYSEDIEEFLNSNFLRGKYKEINDSNYKDFDDAIIEFLTYYLEEQGL